VGGGRKVGGAKKEELGIRDVARGGKKDGGGLSLPVRGEQDSKALEEMKGSRVRLGVQKSPVGLGELEWKKNAG